MSSNFESDARNCPHCGGAFATKGTAMLCPNCVAETLFGDFSEDEESAPERIGSFELMEKLGEGAFGVVYHALQTEPVQREVALKVLKPGMDSKQIIARFEAERQALAVMDHPDISTVYAAGQTEAGRPYFAMELVVGSPLTDFCDKNDLALRSRLQLFVRICGAIEHAHQKGIIHRDLKPNNILVAGDGENPEPKVIDFGIAKATEFLLTDSTLQTGRGQLLGTPEYMSPEQATLGKAEVDTRADVYALGMVLYELLAGAPAWNRETLGDLAYDEFLRTIRESEPRPPSSRQPRLAADLDWIVLTAIDKDRRRRYGSAAALADDVSRFLDHEPVKARPPSTAYRVSKFVRKHRVGVVFCSLLAASLVTGVVVAGILALRADRQRIVAEELRAESKREFSRADLRIANEISVTGRHSAAVAHLCRALRNDPENRPAMQKLVNDLAYRGFPVPAAPPAMIGGSWRGSALLSGDRLVTLGTDDQVSLWQLEKQTEKLEVKFPEAAQLVAAEGGHVIALELLDGSGWKTFDPEGNELVLIPHSFDSVVMSADSKRLIGSDESGIHCFDCQSGRGLWDLQLDAAVTVLSAAATGTTVAAGLANGRIVILFSDGKIGLERELPNKESVRLLETARGAVLAAGDSPAAYFWERKSSSPEVIQTGGVPAALTISQDSDVVAVVAGEALRIRDGDGIRSLGLEKSARGLKLSPDGVTVYASAVGNGSVARIDARSAEVMGAPFRQRQPATSLHFYGNQVAVITSNGSLHRWKRGARSAQIARFDHGGTPLIWAAFNFTSPNLSTGTSDGRIKFWWANGQVFWEMDGAARIPFNYTEDGKILTYDLTDRVINVWDAVAMKKASSMQMQSPPLAGAITEGGGTVVVASMDGSVSLFDAKRGEIVHCWEGLGSRGDIRQQELLNPDVPNVQHRNYIYLSADGKHAAVANDGTDGFILELFPPFGITRLPHAGRVRWMAIDPAKSRVATGSDDNSARVWSFPTGRPLTPYLRHEESCPSSGIVAQFSHDGSQLVTGGSFDSTVRVWDIATGEMKIDPLQHTGVVSAIGVSPDSRSIATGSGNGVRLWDADTGTLIAPVWDMGAPVPELFFEPGAGIRLFAYNIRGDCAVFELVPREFAMEPWLLDFAEALAGLRFNERDVLVPAQISDLKSWEDRLGRGDPDADTPSEQIARWLTTPSGDRESTPFRLYWDIGLKWRSIEELGEARRERLRQATLRDR